MKSLHKLIRSLSGPEKRYVKIQMGKFKKNGIGEQIFDIFSAQKIYDANEVAKNFPSISAKSISTTYQKTYNNVLKFLLSFNPTVESEIQNYLAESDLLLERMLLKEAEKKIDKAIALATKHQLYNYQAIAAKKKYRFYERDIINNQKEIDRAVQDWSDSLNLLESEFKIIDYNLQILKAIIVSNSGDFSEGDKAALLSIRNNLKQLNDENLPEKFRLNFHNLNMKIALILEEPKIELHHLQEILKIVTTDKEETYTLEKKFEAFKFTINSAIVNNELKVAEHLLQDLKKQILPKIDPSNSLLLANYYLTFYTNRLNLKLATNNTNDIRLIIEEFEKIDIQLSNPKLIMLKIPLELYITMCFIANKDYKAALKRIKKAETEYSSSPSYSYFALLIEMTLIVLYFKLELDDLFEYGINNLTRKIRRNKTILKKSENEFLSVLNICLKHKKLPSDKYNSALKIILDQKSQNSDQIFITLLNSLK